MTLENISYFIESLKISISPYSLILIPLLVILVPHHVLSSKTFPAFRIQQFDLQGISYGSQSVAINTEAKIITSNNWIRKCLILHLSEISGHLSDILNKAAALVIIIPNNINLFNEIERENIFELEQRLISSDIAIPIYLIVEDQYNHNDLNRIINTLNSDQNKNKKDDTAFNEMIKAATINTYFVTYKTKDAQLQSSTYSRALDNFELINIQAKLSGIHEEESPNIIIVTHYDTFGLSPALSFGCDSNGSGLAAFLEIARILKMFYSSRQMLPKYNVIFLLTSGGKFTFLGAKKWINDQFENSDINIVSDIAFILCLDSIGSGKVGDTMYLHVSKNHKENSAIHKFFRHLKATSNKQKISIQVSNTKKMYWEHEIFAQKIKSAFTVSSHLSTSSNSQESSKRDTILDSDCTSIIPAITLNTRILAEALLRFLYFPDEDPKNLSENILQNRTLLGSHFNIDEDHILGLMDTFSKFPRSQHLLTKESHILSSIVNHFSDIMKDIRIIPFKADKREPEFVFYDNFEGSLTFYKSKPAIFDLYIAILIGLYLGLVHLFLMYFDTISNIWIKITQNSMSYYNGFSNINNNSSQKYVGSKQHNENNSNLSQNGNYYLYKRNADLNN